MRDIKRIAGGSIKKLMERGQTGFLPSNLLPLFAVQPAVTIGYAGSFCCIINLKDLVSEHR
jgi:hypothetical protein